MGFPLILCVLLFAVLLNESHCTMSEIQQETESKDQGAECSAGDDVEMSSQLTEGIAMEEDEVCSGGEGGRESGDPGDESGKNTANQDELVEGEREPEATQPAATDSQPGDTSATAEEQVQSTSTDAVGESQETMASQQPREESSSEDEGDDEQPKPKPTFPDTLQEFGYKFNKDGQLRSIKEDKPFEFEVDKKDKKYNQAHYEALGEVITEYVYGLLEREAHLEKVYVPLKAKKGEPQSFIFKSADALTNPNKLMLLIHGSGVVRAGQWARSLIINDCLDSGTQLPYIKRAMDEGYGVIVLNTNYNRAEPEGALIKDNGSPKEHAQYVWKNFVKRAKAKKVYIVAHSFGGLVTVDLASTKYDEFKKRVQKIAFTDSVHTLPSQSVSRKAQKWLIETAVNWVTSDHPLDKELKSSPGDVTRRSAGTMRHVETSWCSFEPIFKFFSET